MNTGFFNINGVIGSNAQDGSSLVLLGTYTNNFSQTAIQIGNVSNGNHGDINIDWTQFDLYRVQIINAFPSVGGNVLEAQVSEDSLASLKGVGYDTWGQGIDSTGASQNYTAPGVGQIDLNSTILNGAQSTSQAYESYYELEIIRPNTNNRAKAFRFDATFFAGTATLVRLIGGASYVNDTNPINGIRFWYGLGATTFMPGAICRVYGVKNL